jgi:hypothetical protein
MIAGVMQFFHHLPKPYVMVRSTTLWSALFMVTGLAAQRTENLTVRFAPASAGISPADEAMLHALCERTAAKDLERITLVGHTDIRGDIDYNAALSERRAKAVRAVLANTCLRDVPVEIAQPVGARQTIGAVSDFHFGSKYCMRSQLRDFIAKVRERAVGQEVIGSVSPGQQFVKVVHDKMVALLGDARQDLQLRGPDVVSVLLLLGLIGWTVARPPAGDAWRFAPHALLLQPSAGLLFVGAALLFVAYSIYADVGATGAGKTS